MIVLLPWSGHCRLQKSSHMLPGGIPSRRRKAKGFGKNARPRAQKQFPIPVSRTAFEAKYCSGKKFFNFQLIFRGISVSFIVRKLKMSTRRVICRKMQRDLDVTVCLLFVTTEFRIRVTGKRRSAGLRQLRHPKWTFDRQISFSALWKCVISVLLTVAGDDMTASGRRSRSGALETDRTAGDLPSPGVPPCRM